MGLIEDSALSRCFVVIDEFYIWHALKKQLFRYFNLGAGSAMFESLREDPVCPPPSKKKIKTFSEFLLFLSSILLYIILFLYERALSSSFKIPIF